MKWICIVLLFSCSATIVHAQQRIEPGAMNYVISNKPNSIIYRDTLYKGSTQFMHLFYRTHDEELIRLYRKHQANKITGQALGVVGTIASVIGISMISSGDNKGTGWALLGGGFAAAIGGGYLSLKGQQNLYAAVTLFNQRYHKAALGIGISGNGAGLVYKF